jgi:acyl-CoA reductase-like NAD-dependent aldehyde dehydrogenase
VAGVKIDTRHWIGGQRAGPGGTFTDVSPIDERPLAEIARGGAAEVSAAVRAASAAFPGWAATPPGQRSRILYAIADGIVERAEELAQVETVDNGALLRSHRRGVMPRAAQNFRFFADWLGQLGAGDLEINGHREQVSWDPAGVTAVITLQTFAAEDEAVALANDTRYGLAAMVFTGDRERAARVSARLCWPRGGDPPRPPRAPPGSPASAGRAARGASTSTPTSRTQFSPRRAGAAMDDSDG